MSLTTIPAPSSAGSRGAHRYSTSRCSSTPAELTELGESEAAPGHSTGSASSSCWSACTSSDEVLPDGCYCSTSTDDGERTFARSRSRAPGHVRDPGAGAQGAPGQGRPVRVVDAWTSPRPSPAALSGSSPRLASRRCRETAIAPAQACAPRSRADPPRAESQGDRVPRRPDGSSVQRSRRQGDGEPPGADRGRAAAAGRVPRRHPLRCALPHKGKAEPPEAVTLAVGGAPICADHLDGKA